MRLGDAVAVVFQPIARGIDLVLGTDIQNCGSCKGRQHALNVVSDELFALFVRRARDNDTSPMDFNVTNQTSSTFLVRDAKNLQEAIEKAKAGQGEPAQAADSWTAAVRLPAKT